MARPTANPQVTAYGRVLTPFTPKRTLGTLDLVESAQLSTGAPPGT